ncbi:AN1-like Zinc finger domain-containing protein [Dioscorea alata]|uniref:AN1-like Zinc finger domain-containing protein n=1 Tax=Dioscorea alata TaxID=55571 RepID=A0ACB7VJD4_DIOAL|nr:AN1-like Zinc finger domain-containing protein [Dioscorea alata]
MELPFELIKKFSGNGEKMGIGGGTEAFPELGAHCSYEDCYQLDFLPFNCDGCQKVFCLEHRTYKEHDCPKAEQKSRIVVVCEACTVSIEKKAGEKDEAILERHRKAGECDITKKQKPKCPVKRCKEILTFSNNSTCKSCNLKVCLKHRFPNDHQCKGSPVHFSIRTGTDCRDKKNRSPSSSSSIIGIY